MTLRIHAKVLLHVWSHDVIHWKTAASYDKENYMRIKFYSLYKTFRSGDVFA